MNTNPGRLFEPPALVTVPKLWLLRDVKVQDASIFVFAKLVDVNVKSQSFEWNPAQFCSADLVNGTVETSDGLEAQVPATVSAILNRPTKRTGTLVLAAVEYKTAEEVPPAIALVF